MWVQRQEDGTLAKNEVLIYDYKKQHKKGQVCSAPRLPCHS